MKLSVSSLVIFACLSLNLLAQSSFQISSMDEIVDFDGPYYYTISHQGDQFSFKEFDVDNQEQSESVIDVSGFEGSSDVKFHSMTRYGDSDDFLVILRRNLTQDANLFWQADSMVNHYFKYNRISHSFSTHLVDTTFDLGVKLESYSNFEIYKFDLTGYGGSSDGNGQSATMRSIDDQLNIVQLMHPDSLTRFNGHFGWFRLFDDSLYIFNSYGTVDYVNMYQTKYDLSGLEISENYANIAAGLSWPSIRGLKLFEDSIFAVRSGGTHPEIWSFYCASYNFNVHHNTTFSHPDNLLQYDGEVDYRNRHVVYLARDVVTHTAYPMRILLYDFQGNLICQSQIPYHHLNTEVGLESLNGIVYLKHAVNDSIDQWEPFTCGILNAESYSEIPEDELIVYPSPTSDVLQVQSTFSGNFQINDLQGRMVYEQNANSGVTSIDVSKLKGGNYIIKFFGEGKVIQKKFIKL